MSASNRLGARWSLLATALVVVTLVAGWSSSSSVIGQVSAISWTATDQQDPLQAASNRVSLLIKRSLCNTFGGCGTKRSSIEPTSRGPGNMIAPTNSRESFADPAAPDNNIGSSRDDSAQRSTKTRLIGELIDDLFEYLQTGAHSSQATKLILVQPGETLINAADQPADSVWPAAKKQRLQRMLFN